MPDVQMDYDDMDAMIAAFTRSLQRMEEARANMKQAAAIIRDGALVGNQGTQMLSLIGGRILPLLNASSVKFQELIGDLNGAVEDMRNADSTASGYFY